MIPPAPSNVTYVGGLSATDPVTITWEFPDQGSKITGFRVYRAPANSTDFLPVAAEDQLTSTTRKWVDSDLPACNRAYYVVAVYQDLNRPAGDQTVETNSGSSSYVTPPCP